MATALGQQILTRYYEGTATMPHLDQAKARGWINQAEYDRAIAGLPPENYVPQPTRLAAADESA